MTVRVSRRARREIDDIFDDLAERASPAVALRVVDAFERKVLSLETFPERGARFTHPKLEKLRYLLETPYLIVYEVSSSGADIIAVMHGSRDVEADLLRLTA